MFGKKVNSGNELMEALPMLKKKVHLGKKAPIEYDEMKMRERMEAEAKKKEGVDELLESIFKYSSENGKITDFSLEGMPIINYFRTLTNEQLRDIYDLIMFAHDPFCPECQTTFDEGIHTCLRCEVNVIRLIVTIPDHKKMNQIILVIKNFIPGFKEELEITKLQKQLGSDAFSLEEKKVFSMSILELRKHVERKKQKLSTMPIHVKKEVIDTTINIVCEGCKRKDFKSNGGLKAHQRFCEPYKTMKA